MQMLKAGALSITNFTVLVKLCSAPEATPLLVALIFTFAAYLVAAVIAILKVPSELAVTSSEVKSV